MNILHSLMNVAFTWQELFDPEKGALNGGQWGWVATLMSVLTTVLWVVLALVGAAGGIYAVFVGIKMARADSAEQREENKKRLVNIVVSVVVVIALIVFFNVFLPAIVDAFMGLSYEQLEGGDAGNTAVNAVRALLRVR